MLHGTPDCIYKQFTIFLNGKKLGFQSDLKLGQSAKEFISAKKSSKHTHS